ncbi:MAG TPA: hypothetical protein ENI99_01865 [Sedimenticola sp.]|nr:hypothetical protein [Sedimenticola sp.]
MGTVGIWRLFGFFNSYQLSVISYQLSVVSCQLSAVSCRWSKECRLCCPSSPWLGGPMLVNPPCSTG